MKLIKRRNFLWYSLLFVAGCTAATSNPNDSFPKPAGSRPEHLRFAVTEVQDLKDLQRDYEPFRLALEQVLEKKIEFFPVKNFIAAAGALHLDQVDLVLAGPSEYVVIRTRTNAVPVIAITRPNYHTVIAVRADSGIKSVRELKGKTIAMGAVGAASSHLGPTKLLLDAGLNPQSDLKIIMLGTKGSKGLQALKNGEVDAWAGVPHRYEKFLRTEGLSESAFSLIVTGPPLPSDVFIANSKLDSAFLDEIRSRMVKNQDKLIQGILASVANERYKESKLVPANDADYNMIREVYKAVGQGDFIQ